MNKFYRLIIISMCIIFLFTGCNTVDEEKKNENGTSYTNEEGQQTILKNTNTSNLLLATTRQELADRLGCTLEELDNFVIYATHLNEILPDGEESETTFQRGTSESGLHWVTKEEAKSFVTPILLTQENWSKYLVAGMFSYESIYYDEDGEEQSEIKTSPDIKIKEEYQYDWTSFEIVLKENSTGTIFEYQSYWRGAVSEDQGTYYVEVCDSKGWYHNIEFTSSNFTCIKADGVLYAQEIPEELLIVIDEDGNYLKYVDHKTEYDLKESMLPIVSDAEDPEGTICLVGYSGIGAYVTKR